MVETKKGIVLGGDPPALAPKMRYRVRTGELLHLPDSVHANERVWLKAGECIDTTHPAIAAACAGQEYKLILDADSSPNEAAPWPEGIRGFVANFDERAAKVARENPVAVQAETAAVAAGGSSVSKPDAMPTKPPAKL